MHQRFLKAVATVSTARRSSDGRDCAKSSNDCRHSCVHAAFVLMRNAVPRVSVASMPREALSTRRSTLAGCNEPAGLPGRLPASEALVIPVLAFAWLATARTA